MDSKSRQKIAVAMGRAIAGLRQRAGLGQEDVGARLGVGQEAISRIERGAVLPSVTRLYELAEVFGCRAEDLLREASERPQDGAAHLEKMLAPLAPADRKLVLDVAERMSEHFPKRAARGRA